MLGLVGRAPAAEVIWGSSRRRKKPILGRVRPVPPMSWVIISSDLYGHAPVIN